LSGSDLQEPDHICSNWDGGRVAEGTGGISDYWALPVPGEVSRVPASTLGMGIIGAGQPSVRSPCQDLSSSSSPPQVGPTVESGNPKLRPGRLVYNRAAHSNAARFMYVSQKSTDESITPNLVLGCGFEKRKSE
jgi:hypothetical protein